MSFLTTFTRAQSFANIAQTYDNVANIPADTSEGSLLGSSFQGASLASMAFQSQAVYLASIARLGTIGPNPIDPLLPNPDVDSFVNAFNVFREEATAATGQVTVSLNYAPSANVLIPAVPAGSTSGVTFKTASGILFIVIADTTNPAYNLTLNGYVIASSTTSVSVTVQCLSVGTQGNVAAGQISQIYSGPSATVLAYNANVTNPVAFDVATPLETDTALKNRFANLMTASASATATAIAYAIGSVALGLTFAIGDCVPTPGYATIIVNNANTPTLPSATLLTQVTAAVLAARTLGITHYVNAPTLVPVNLSCIANIAPGYSPTAVSAAINTACNAYLNGINLNQFGGSTSAKLAACYSIIYTTPGVSDVQSLTLNGQTTDVIGPFGQQLVAGTISVSTA